METHLIRLCGREVERPGHICAFFSSPEEEYATLLPYFRDGVDTGEDVLNIVDDASIDERVRSLQSSAMSIGENGVTVLGADQTYLATGRFEMEQMAAFVEQQLAAARLRGRMRSSFSMARSERIPSTFRPSTIWQIFFSARPNIKRYLGVRRAHTTQGLHRNAGPAKTPDQDEARRHIITGSSLSPLGSGSPCLCLSPGCTAIC